MKLKVKLTNKNAKAPMRANPTDGGADLFSPIEVTLPPQSHFFVDFGVQTEIPDNHCGLMFARSGIGSKFGITPRNCVGVIDSKYRGNLGVMVENKGNNDFKIEVGDRIMQLVIVPVLPLEIEVVDELDMNDDRCGGWGHSGK